MLQKQLLKVFVKHKGLNVTPSKYIKHKRSMDVCFAIYHQDIWLKSVLFSGEWYNQGQVAPFRLGRYETIQIMKEDIPNWLETDETDFRKANWYPLKY